MVSHLSDAQLHDVRDAFNLINQNAFASSFSDVLLPLRFVGCTATLDDLKLLYPGDKLDFATFLDLYSEQLGSINNQPSIEPTELSRLLAKHFNRSVDTNDWRRILSSFGDRIESLDNTTLCKLIGSASSEASISDSTRSVMDFAPE
ncbi:unnamed protein product [Dicrocoelium dendriticum]|nr:unnamed protein product [Dicrocoelium dendriticum]